MRFYVTRESYEWRTAVSDRGYSWAGAEEGRRSFYVWGEPATAGSLLKRIKTGLQHGLQNRTYFDSWSLDDAKKRECVDRINGIRPQALVGYAGNLVEMARFARNNPGLLKWKAKTLVTAAEGLHAGQRELLEEQLADEVFMSYGSREFMLIGMECSEHNGYHVASDNLYVEVVRDDGSQAAPGETGRILVTDLRNAANPFIRYEIGDLGAMAQPDYRCKCGLPFPVLARVDGRAQERIQLPDGSSMTALFMPHIMKEFKWVEGYQIVQKRVDEMRVNIISACNLSEELTKPIREKLRERAGPGMSIEFARVETLEKSRSGKTPIVVTGKEETTALRATAAEATTAGATTALRATAAEATTAGATTALRATTACPPEGGLRDDG
jgi:phenylacetate-CoA ligase